ncbi:MAG: hypothetical protein ACLP51_01785 [Syntrophobacteraceae bacterium]
MLTRSAQADRSFSTLIETRREREASSSPVAQRCSPSARQAVFLYEITTLNEKSGTCLSGKRGEAREKSGG